MTATPTSPEAPAVMDVRSVPKLGILAWSFVGAVAATAIVVTAFGAVSEILLPLVFAAVLAVVFKPLVGKLERRGPQADARGRRGRARPGRADDRRHGGDRAGHPSTDGRDR